MLHLCSYINFIFHDMSSFNDTSVCSAENSAELLEAVDVDLLTAQSIVISGIGLIGAILTISLIVVILANKDLRTRTFIFCLQLLVLDAMLILFIHAPISVTSLARKWVFGFVWCKITGVASHFISYWRCSILFVLTLDRFSTVFYPFTYRKIAKKVLAVVLIILLATCIILACIPAFETLGVGCYKFSDFALYCIDSGKCYFHIYACYIYRMIAVSVVFLVGGLLPVGMYIAMCMKARKIQSDVPQLGEFEGEESNTYNQQEHMSNQRANITVAILFICLIILAFPFIVANLLFPLITKLSFRYYIIYAVNNLFFSTPITDPIIIWRNKDIKEKVKMLFKKYCRKSIS